MQTNTTNTTKSQAQGRRAPRACLALLGLIASLQLVSAQTAVLYQEDWGTTNGGSAVASAADVGWDEVLPASISRGFYQAPAAVDDTTAASLPAGSMWFGGTGTGMFYTTNGAGSGTYGDSAFTSVDPTLYTNLQFSLYSQYNYQGSLVQTWFAVQVGGAWYVSTNNPIMPNTAGGNTYHGTDMTYSPAATNWNTLTVDTINTNVIIGGPAGADLSGPITGIGVVTDPNTGWLNLNELQITSISNSAAAVLPTLVAPPLPQSNVYAGGGVSFTVGASPSQPYDYYWQKGGVTLTNDSRISGVHSATLTILNATAADDGNYSVIVSNSVGFFDTSTNYTGPAYLSVNSVPSDYLYAETFPFVGPSTSLNYSLGTVGWSNSVPYNPNRLFYAYGNGAISAAENYSQTFPNTTFFYTTTNSDTGTSGLAFPAIDPTAYPAVAFSVDVAPTPNFNGPGLSTAYFAVQMNGGSWYVGSTPIPVNTSQASTSFSTYQQQFSPSASVWNNLTFNSTGATIGSQAGAGLTGKITGAGVVVVATYGTELDFQNFLVTTDTVAVIAPTIDIAPRSQTVYTGGGVSFQVHVQSGTGTQPLYYFWQKDGVTLTNNSRISGAGGAMVTITGTSTNDAGNYSCIVSNSAGTDNSGNYATATLTVNPTPPGLLYAETLPTPEVPDGFYPTATVGWTSTNSLGIYAGGPNGTASFYSGGAGKSEFYATTASDAGASGLPFPSLNLAVNTNLALSTTIGVYDTNTTAGLIVQITSGATTNWFISATGLPLQFTTMNYVQAFAPGATNWNNFDVNTMTVGSQAASDLTGSLTGAGVFINYGTNGENGSFSYFSISLAVPPPMPVGLSATAGDTQVALSWTASFGATSYNVKRSTTSGGEVTITNVTVASYTDTQVTNGTPYYYEVSAVNAFGESTNSVEANATPQAPQLGSISVGSFAGNTLTLNWTASPNVGLQSTTNLTPPIVWTDVPGTTGLGTAAISTTNTVMFFRLVQP